MLKNTKRTKPECKFEIPDDYYPHITYCRKMECKYYGGECRDDCEGREVLKDE